MGIEYRKVVLMEEVLGSFCSQRVLQVLVQGEGGSKRGVGGSWAIPLVRNREGEVA